MTNAPPQGILTLLDDAALARRVLEMSSAIARQLQRPLEVVYVESAPALLAASLPFAQVLAHGGAQWLPLAPQDIERGYRVQEARLRELAERITLRHTIHWSMRVMRGVLAQAALQLHGASDLMLVGSAAGAPWSAPFGGPQAQARARPAIRVVTDNSVAGEQAQRMAQQVAQALGGVLSVRHAGAGLPDVVASTGRCDLLVLPRSLVAADTLAALVQPVLLVG